MSCTCSKGQPFSNLLPIVDEIAATLMAYRQVSGVALSGSTARRESHCHDIDLVVFHGGDLEDGNCRTPQRDNGTDVLLESMVGARIAQVLRHRTDVPVSYFFMHEKILWDCKYLQSFTKKERFPGFYRTVVSQIPLYLLWVSNEAKSLLRFVDGIESVALYSGDGFLYEGIWVEHRCGEEGCMLVEPWDKVHKQILARKELGRSVLRNRDRGFIEDPPFDS